MNPDSLEQLYKSKTDEELLSLASEKETLTEDARQYLGDELRRRRLDDLPAIRIDESLKSDEKSVEKINPEQRSNAAWLGLLLLNVAVVYVCALRLAPMLVGRWFAWVTPFVGFPRGISAADWSLQHLPLMSIIVGAVAGYIDLPRFLPSMVGKRIGQWRSDSAALWAWSVPCLLLLYKMLAFKSPSSVLYPNSMSAFRYFFEIQQAVPTFANPFAGDPVRVLAQMYLTAPFYTGVAYSLGALASRYGILQSLFRREI